MKSLLLSPFRILFDFIFPPYCPLTSVKLKDNENLYSNSVLFKLEISGNPIQIRDLKLNNLIQDDIYFDNLYSLFANFTESQEIIHSIKYSKYQTVGFQFGENLGIKIKKEKLVDYDFIIPVPLHKVRQRERGFNQAYVIAEGVNSILKSNLIEFGVNRIKYTTTQTKLSAKDRKKNLENVFEINKDYKNLIENKNVLIIDDVFTTGSTINAVAKELKKYNCNKIDCATLTLA